MEDYPDCHSISCKEITGLCRFIKIQFNPFKPNDCQAQDLFFFPVLVLYEEIVLPCQECPEAHISAFLLCFIDT